MYLGIDVGTSGVKATITDRMGNALAYAYQPLITHGVSAGNRELNPVQVKEKVIAVMQEVVSRYGRQHIAMITISSLGEAVIPIDKNGEVLMNSIIGSDSRGADELEWVKGQVGEAELVRITGVNLSAIYSLNKILYLQKHFPNLQEHVWKYMCFTDYVGFFLTGEAMIDFAMASRTMAFDIGKQQWSQEILQKTGISSDVFSKPVQGGTMIGTLLPSVSQQLGISCEVPVMVGSHDHIMNALGAGVVLPGSCSNIVGTTEGITAILPERMPETSIARHNISCEPFVLPKLYNTVAWHNTAGAMVKWYLSSFYGDSQKTKDAILRQLNENVPRHPSDLMVLPHFSGATTNHMDEKAKGAVIGLTTTTQKEEIYKAVLEGACYECKVIIEGIQAAGLPVEQIIVSGGGSRSLLWLQTKADMLGQPILQAAQADTGALGGAILAAVVSGEYHSLEEAAGVMVRPGNVIEPNMRHHMIYKERYEEYKKLYQSLKQIHHSLTKREVL